MRRRTTNTSKRATVCPCLILLVLLAFFFFPREASSQEITWTVFAAQSEPSDDPVILEMLTELELTASLAIARGLPDRAEPDLSTVFSGLLQASLDQRGELFMRVALDRLLALAPPIRDEALESNRDTLMLLFNNVSRLDSAMLRAAVWRAATLSATPVRRELLPAARTAAAALNDRATDATEASRATVAEAPLPGDGPPDAARSPRSYEQLAFLSFARSTPDRTLSAIVDELRAKSRDPRFVRRARAVLSEED